MDGRELEGRRAIVTGGAIGIGNAIVRELALAGAEVVVADLNNEEAAAAALREAGLSAAGVTIDVSSPESVEAGVARVHAELGKVDVLVNNAGIFAPLVPGPFEQIDVEEWRRVMEVNVLGPFLMAKAVLPSMRALGGGRIINIASTTAFKGTSNLLHYTTSKGAVVAMTRALARELGRDQILVNAVAPGFTVSDGVNEHAAAMAAMRTNAPGARALGREMVPDDLVGAVRFLAGPLSGFMTGQTLVVDGGAYFH